MHRFGFDGRWCYHSLYQTRYFGMSESELKELYRSSALIINLHGSHHTDAILSSSVRNIDQFVKRVDSASVIVNASTRFADGGEYGLGAEIGISTDKLHARGPMGASDLTTYKWIVTGDGHIR